MTTFALVLGFRFDQSSQRSCEIGISKDLAGLRPAAVWQIDLHAGWIFVKFLRRRQRARQRIAHGKSIFRQVDRFRKYLRKIHRAPTIEQDVPRIDTARHCSGEQRIIHRQLSAIVLFVPLNRREAWGRAFSIDRIDSFRLRVIHQQCRIGADAVHSRIDNSEHCLAGNDCVESIATFFQNAFGSAGRFGFHRRDGKMLSAHDWTHGPVCSCCL